MTSITTPSLNQGKNFKKYKNKDAYKEGFSDMNAKSLTKSTRNVINSNDYSKQQDSVNNLREEYNKTLQEYQDLEKKISGNVTGYINRVSNNNPYLNKVVSFTTGEICYVTNQGVVKWIASMDIWKTLNISQKTQVKLNIPWDNSYNTPGTQIPTTPPLVSGTPIISGQTLGNEGTTVFVDNLLPANSKATYVGCYAANSKNDNMTFIDETPPPLDAQTVQNGNFSNPQIASNSYQYLVWNSTLVPGWNFNCVLLNNSTSWGFPIPYPNGNQCACIQTSQQLWTNNWVYFVSGKTYTLTFSACGRNCCDGSGLANPINIGLEGNTFYTLNATVGKWQTYTVSFVPQSTGGQRLSFIGDWTSSDRSTAIQNVQLNMKDGGSYSYKDCEQAAKTNGYRYFGLQNVNTSTGLGYCAVSNSEPAVKQYGVAQVPNKMTALWSSNTSGQPGNTAILSGTGSLQVVNSSGQAVYSTPSQEANPSNYLGCYGDASNSIMTLFNNGSRQYNNQQCQQIAVQNGYQYYGLQDSTSGTNAQCTLSNNISKTMSLGKATNCTKLSDGSWSGGGLSNAVYSASQSQSNYYISIQNDGNMMINRGTGPNDNQGSIWATNTSGQQRSPNPNMIASNGKYSQSWAINGATLAPGDFIGSDDGSVALVMQSDGNLVLYTYDMVANCSKIGKKQGGGVGANAVYDIGTTSISQNMGKMGFIDSDSNLYTYPDNNQTFSNNYSTISNAKTDGNDIAGSFANATVESCKTFCNENDDCAGFLFDKNGNVCYPKNKNMYPYGGNIYNTENVDLYMRTKEPITPPLGVSSNVNNINTIEYQNYVNKGNVGKQYGLANATDVQKQQLTQLQTKMNMLSKQINDMTIKYQSGTMSVGNQSDKNVKGLSNYLQNLTTTNVKIVKESGETSGNIQNIVNDSNVNVLHENYKYILWSILATGTVLVSMNIINK